MREPYSRGVQRIGGASPRELVSERALHALTKVTESIPNIAVSGSYLECRLGRDQDVVNGIALVRKGGARLLAGGQICAPNWASEKELAAFQSLHRMFKEWSDPSRALHHAVSHAWLEFDALRDTASEHQALPGVYLSIANKRPAHFMAKVALRSALIGLRACLPERIPLSVRELLERCFVALPEGTYVPYIGTMFRGAESAVRMCVRGLPEDCLGAFLGAIGWCGNVNLAHSLASVVAQSDYESKKSRVITLLHLDIGDTVGPNLGMEHHFSRTGALTDPAEVGWMDEIVKLNWCSPEKRSSLRQWSRLTGVSSPLANRLNHIKVVLNGHSGAVVAKAYLYFPKD